MALSKLRKYIEEVDERNTGGRFDESNVRGISTTKKFIPTKADLRDVPLTNYKIVRKNQFAYVPDTSRRGDKISLAFNDSDEVILVSSITTVFTIVKPEELLPYFLFMYFNRPEFDRYARFNSWGSAREAFDFEDFKDMELEIPDRVIQEKYVDIYLGLIENQRAYDTGLDDLGFLCESFVEHERRTTECKKIGPLIEEFDERNNGRYGAEAVMGISTLKQFIGTKADLRGVSLDGYKVVPPQTFAYVADTSRRGDKMSLALNTSSENYLVSSITTTFRIKNPDELQPEYLSLFFMRSEFDRYARYHSWGSAREAFDWEALCEMTIPIPDAEVQTAIIEIARAKRERKALFNELSEVTKNICAILIRGATKEGERA